MSRTRAPQLVAAALVAGTALAAQGVQPATSSRVYVTDAAATLVQQGLALPAPTGADAAAFQAVPPPAVRNVPNVAFATSDPWIESNAWRFQRGLRQAHYESLPVGSAGLAAAEAFTFGVDAMLNPDPADTQPLADVLRFLNAQDQPRMPSLANIGIVDDGTPAMGEALNMLTRRNLLYRVVQEPDRRLDLTVRLGTRDFPADAVMNPSEFAARVRAKLGDDKRLVRLFGSTTAIAHLTGAGGRVRLYLLSYSRNRTQPGLRVRLTGRYQPAGLAAYGAAPEATLVDVRHPGRTTEFSLPPFSTIAIVDLTAMR
jgi:hypothetical protein